MERQLGRGEQVAAGGALALLVLAALVSWFSFGELGFTGFEAASLFRDLVMLLTVAAGIGLGVAAGTTPSVNATVVPAAAAAALGTINTALILIWVIDPPEATSREIGLFLGLIASAAVAYGGWVAMQEEGA